MGVTFLVRNSNPVVASHQVHGFKVLPGLTYIDLIYQFFRRSGHHFAELELRHLAIHQPMVLPGNDDILVEIQAPEIRPGVWQVRVEGTRQQEGRPTAEKACYAVAEMHRVDTCFEANEHQSEPPVPRDRLPAEDIYATFRPRGLVHSGFMQVRGHGFSTPTHAFADVGLSDEATDSNERYMFHPALLDGGVTCASGMLPGSDIDDGSPGGGLYIPLSYDTFRATSLVRGRCIARIDHATLRRRNDLFLVTIDFLDTAGRKIAELRNLALKALRRSDAISEASGQSGSRTDTIASLSTGPRQASLREPPVMEQPAASDPATEGTQDDPAGRLRALIAAGIAGRLGVPSGQVDPTVGYYEMGLDSVGLLQLVKLLESHLRMSLSPTLLFEYTTIDELVGHLVERYADLPARLGETPPAPVAAVDMAQTPASSRQDDLPDESIAIVGMAGRFPQSRDIGQLWQNLKDGKDCIGEIPADRWDWHLFDGLASVTGRDVSRWGGFVADADRFDARFFRITPRAAEVIDPQERLFLEVSWEAIEDAGYTPRTLAQPNGVNQRRSVGVFAGVMHKDYLLWQAKRLFDGQLQSLSMSNAPIANRVSYFCNFHGPSVVIDTLCSSSLTAVHMASESLRRGECQVALAGGVNLSLHPGKYLTFALLGMHSSDGRCRTFGEGGDGYVAGEGVGTVVLKPLSRAIADNDHVYAVIRGSSVNHVGAVSGISVPSPVAQADLIADCLARTGIDPRTISYVEAHGTGTALGDPIEIEGLTRAFRTGTDAVGYCAIGSIKSNMGHAESAAGIAGIIKLALQLRHATLVPSLHGERPNPHIDWATTPFVVQTRTSAWERPRIVSNGQETVHPRRAAISSFGAAGSNAHAILEEYVPGDEVFRPDPATLAIVPVSAQTTGQLREAVRRLLDHLASSEALDEGTLVHRVAYTLQRGREAYAARAAFLADDLDGLKRSLAVYLDSANDTDSVFVGPAPTSAGGVVSDAADTSPAYIRAAVSARRYVDVARAWVAGATIDWGLIYTGLLPRRVSLPTYPFAGERYWIDESTPAVGEAAKSDSLRSTLHPAVHENTSSFDQQRFTSRFDGSEDFLRDHVVNGVRVLPGVVYLEMACVALGRAADASSPPRFRLHNAVWAQPVVAGTVPVTVHTSVARAPTGDLRCEIHGDGGTVHFQCAATPMESAESALDLDALRGRCAGELPIEDCYRLLEAGGLRYGDTFRSMKRLWQGRDPDDTPFVLAHLDLPDAARPGADLFGLHPSILDGALQASLGLMLMPGEAVAPGGRMLPYVPYALESLDVFGPCHGEAYAIVRSGPGNGARLRKLEVTVCDATGHVRVRLRGFAARLMDGVEAPASSGTPSNPTGEPASPITFEEQWHEAPLPVAGAARPARVVVLYAHEASGATLREAILTEAPGLDAHFRVLAADPPGSVDEHAGDSHAQAIAQMDTAEPADVLIAWWAVERAPCHADFRSLVALLQTCGTPTSVPVRIVLAAVCRTPRERAYVDSWIALVPSLRRIVPHRFQIVGTVVDAAMDAGQATRLALSNVLAELGDQDAPSVFYEAGVRLARRMVPTSRVDVPTVLRHGGTYLVTGGLGGLGGRLADRLVRRYRANLLLISRSAPDATALARMREWSALGSHVVHARADIAQAGDVRAAVDAARGELGDIDGVFHVAGVAARGSVFEVGYDDVERVLAPKIHGTLALDEVFAGTNLDFVCHFSSSSAVLGDFGACAYAIANRFQSAFVRASRAPAGTRRLAVSWPLWQDGGMGIGDEQATASYLASSGQRALPTEEGLDLLERLLAEPAHAPLVLAGESGPLHRLLAAAGLDVPSAPGRAPIETATAPSNDPLAARLLRSLRVLLGESVKLPLDRVFDDTPLDEYGFDSILAMQMTNELEKSFGSLSKTLFFEHHDLASVNRYLMREHRPAVLRMYGIESNATPSAVLEPMSLRQARATATANSGASLAQLPDRPVSGDIAIVGFSGRFPQAPDLETFWRNLRTGSDGITAIPPERWNHDTHYDARKGVFGKTYCRWGGFLDDVDAFDPLFFNMTPIEAQFTDPQQRLFLETVWNLLESSGYTRDALQREYGGNVGVYVGSMYNQYGATGDDPGVDAVGTSPQGGIANRVSYFFDLQGPSIAIDTMCSSAFAAIHMACTDLRSGACPLAIAGGVNLTIHPKKYITLGQAQMLASQSGGRSFGDTDGYLPAEAVGAVLLKPLQRALADADTILGVVKGSAVNHGGRSNGYSVPNPDAQSRVMRDALRDARLEPSAVTCVEAAANGSPLGDAIEMAALKTVFAGMPEQGCPIGSVKSNIGHAEAASGMAQLAKVLLQMHHGELVPTIHSEPGNPAIVFESSAFRLQRTVEPWSRERPRVAMINSFGAGGSNACLVVAEYEHRSVDDSGVESFDGRHLVIVSARSVERLRVVVRELASAVSADPAIAMDDLAYTLQCGREAMASRLALVVGDRVELLAALAAHLTGEVTAAAARVASFVGGAAEGASFRSFTSGSAGQALLDTLLRERDVEKLALFWVNGGTVPWRTLYAARRRIVPLPGYPFARQSYALPRQPVTAIRPIQAPRQVDTCMIDGRRLVPPVHPLLHVNSSDIGEYRFSSTFTGDEPFVVRDDVRGLRLLPEALCIEMFRAAVEHVSGRSGEPVRLVEMRWYGPVEIEGGPVTVHVGMRVGASGRIDGEVYSVAERATDGDDLRRVYLRGTAVSSAAEPLSEGADLAPLRAPGAHRMTTSQWTGSMRHIGLEYGEAYSPPGTVWTGSDEAGHAFVIVDLDVSTEVPGNDAAFGMSPALLNIALQAATLQLAREGEGGQATVTVPATLACRELAIVRGPADATTAWIRASGAPDGSGPAVDIDLLDGEGHLLARFVDLRDATGLDRVGTEDVSSDDASRAQGYDIGRAPLLALSHRDVVAPRNELETTLLAIWQEALGFSSIGVFDSFLDMGGSSLTAARVVAMIDEQYRVTLDVPTLLVPQGTIAHLSGVVVQELARQVAAESEG